MLFLFFWGGVLFIDVLFIDVIFSSPRSRLASESPGVESSLLGSNQVSSVFRKFHWIVMARPGKSQIQDSKVCGCLVDI